MLNLVGEIGVLYQEGKQVAGIYGWEIHCWLEYVVTKGYKDYKPIKKISARAYWLNKEIEDNDFYAEFYKKVDGNLVILDAGNVSINFPDTKTLDRRLDAELKMDWLGVEY